MGKRKRGEPPKRPNLKVKPTKAEAVKKIKPAPKPKPPAKKKVEGEPSLPAALALTPKLDKKMKKGEKSTGGGGSSDKNKSTSRLENTPLVLGDVKTPKKTRKAPNRIAKAVKEFKPVISTPASSSVDIKVEGKRKIKAGAEVGENPPKRLKGKAKGTMEASRPGPSTSTNEMAKIDESINATINAANIIDDIKSSVNKTPEALMKSQGKAGKQPKKPSPALKIGAKSVKQKGTTGVAMKSNKQALKLNDIVNKNKSDTKKKPLTKAAKMQASVSNGPTVEPRLLRKRTMESPKVGKKSKETMLPVIAVKAKIDDEIEANADEKEQNASRSLKGEAKGTHEANRAGLSLHVNVNVMIDESNTTNSNAAESSDDKKRAVSKNQTPKALKSKGKAGKQPRKPSPAPVPKISEKSPTKRKGTTKVGKKSNTPSLKLEDVNDDAKTLNRSRSDKKKNPYKVARMKASESESHLDNHVDYGDIDDNATTQSLRPPSSSLPIAGSLESWSNSNQEERVRLYENKDVGHNYRKILEESLMVLDMAKGENYSLIDHHAISAKYLKTVRKNKILVQSLTAITMRNNDELQEKVAELKSRCKQLEVLRTSLNMKLQAQANSANQESLSAKSYEEKLSTIKSEFNNRLKVLKLKFEKLQTTYNWYRSHLKVKNVMSPQKSSGGVGVNKGRKVKKELRNKAKKDGNSSDESSPGLNCIDIEKRVMTLKGARKRALVSADAKKLINFPDKLDCPSKMPTTSSDESDDDDENVTTTTIAEKQKPLKTSAAPVSVRQQIEEMLAAERGNQIKLSLITTDDKDGKEEPKPAEMPIETGKVSSGSDNREGEMEKTPSILSSSSDDDESENGLDLDFPYTDDEESESEDVNGTTTEKKKKKMLIDESETRVVRGKRAFDGDEAGCSSENVSKRIKVASGNTVENSMVSSIKSPIPQSLLDDLSDTESEIMAILEKSKCID